MRRYALYIIILAITAIQATAQNRINGKVTDLKGNPIYGASVVLDSRSWAITDSLGQFRISTF